MKKMLGLLAICLLAAGAASAQTAIVNGTVTDDQGAFVEGARVSLHMDGQCIAHVFTNADGFYEFTEVAAGTYDVKAGKPHVGNATAEDVVVDEGATVTVDLVLGCAGPQGPGGPHGPKYQHEQQNRYGGGE